MDNYKIAVEMLIEVCEVELEQLRYLTNHFRDMDVDNEEITEHLLNMTLGIEKRIKVVNKLKG